MAGSSVATPLPDIIQSNAIWHRLHNFCQAWNKTGSTLNKNVDNIWLEFDVENEVTDIPLPSCFFGPQSLHSQGTHQWISQVALPLLLDDALPSKNERKLFDCLATLPDQANVFQIGLMLARATRTIRLCIIDIDSQQIPTYLAQLGWPGSESKLNSLIKDLTSLVDTIVLDIDVGQTLLPKIGLECYLKNQPSSQDRWHVFLDYLVEQGLCCPDKREGLLAYPGYVREKTQQPHWPDHLRTMSNLLGDHYESIFVKGIHHLKVVYQPDCLLQVKAYLYVKQGWLPINLVKQQLRLMESVQS
ncbi:hypothetical protein ACFLXQ_04470 [Chloroflexota bacterium]